MKKIYSYVLRIDDGAAPNPFWGICTLTICKPVIRRNADIGDWVIGTGSKNAKCNDSEVHDLSNCLVYAMEITDKKLLKDYDSHCILSLIKKIPDLGNNDWRYRVGDCIYDYSKKPFPALRKSVHNKGNRKTDLNGFNSLISNHFYYFGEKAVPVPSYLIDIIKHNQGHKKIINTDLIKKFEEWIRTFQENTLYADPQMKWQFDKQIFASDLSLCAKRHYDEDQDESEETIC